MLEGDMTMTHPQHPPMPCPRLPVIRRPKPRLQMINQLQSVPEHRSISIRPVPTARVPPTKNGKNQFLVVILRSNTIAVVEENQLQLYNNENPLIEHLPASYDISTHLNVIRSNFASLLMKTMISRLQSQNMRLYADHVIPCVYRLSEPAIFFPSFELKKEENRLLTYFDSHQDEFVAYLNSLILPFS